jgi:DNA invertase Pin-like site-specific DNA recombinase
VNLACAPQRVHIIERDLVRERTTAGLAAARARGRTGGRPTLMTPAKLAIARQLYASDEQTVAAIAATLGVSRASVYRHLGPADAEHGTDDPGSQDARPLPCEPRAATTPDLAAPAPASHPCR